MTSTLKFRSKAICLKMLSQRVVLPAALPPATPIIIFWFGSSTRLLLRGWKISLILFIILNDLYYLSYLPSNYPVRRGDVLVGSGR
jgi:hypothetical protein